MFRPTQREVTCQHFPQCAEHKLRILLIEFACTLMFFSIGMLLAGCTESRKDVALGTLERERIELVSNNAERIVQVFVRAGDRVTDGQPVMHLDSKTGEIQLAALLALREQAAAHVAELVRGPRKELIAEAQAIVFRSKSLLLETELNHSRIEVLVSQNLASESALDQSLAKHAAAKATLEANQARLDALENGTTPEKLSQARQAMRQVQADVDLQRLIIDKHTITASRDGVIDDLLFKEGEQPQIGAVVAVLLASNTAYARVYIPQLFRTRIQIGTKMQVYLDGVAAPLQGVVQMISSDPVFTPYFALTERDRSRLCYLTEIAITEESANQWPTGIPVQVELPTRN